jgi:two-component system response regulator LytT
MINCLLLDDDPAVLLYLRSFIEQTPFLNLIAAHLSPADALKTLGSNTVQLIFVDINLSGVEFSRMLSAKEGQMLPRVILTGSSSDYTIDGSEIKALDYLPKPISYEAFLKAAYKAQNTIDVAETGYPDNAHLLLKVENDLVKIFLNDIIYIEGSANYVKVYTKNHPDFIKSYTTIKNIEEKLPHGAFIRIHPEFILSVDYIESVSKNTIKIGEAVIPITEQYKEAFKTFTDQLI